MSSGEISIAHVGHLGIKIKYTVSSKSSMPKVRLGSNKFVSELPKTSA